MIVRRWDPIMSGVMSLVGKALGLATAAATRRSSPFASIKRRDSPNSRTRPTTNPGPPRAECPPNTKMSSPTSQSSSTTSAPATYPVIFRVLTRFPFFFLFRALEPSRPDSPARTIQSAFPPHSMSHPACLVAYRALHSSFLSPPSPSPASGGQSTFASWRAPSRGTFS